VTFLNTFEKLDLFQDGLMRTIITHSWKFHFFQFTKIDLMVFTTLESQGSRDNTDKQSICAKDKKASADRAGTINCIGMWVQRNLVHGGNLF
jgi:hypothetical protein